MKLRLMRLLAWWRLLWGFCPECNSDAPELYTCLVCCGWRGESFPPDWLLRSTWMMSWEAKRVGKFPRLAFQDWGDVSP